MDALETATARDQHGLNFGGDAGVLADALALGSMSAVVMSRPNQSEWSSVIRFWLWRRSATGNSADWSRHLSTNVVTPSLKRTDDLRSEPSREARELFNLGLVHPWNMAWRAPI